MLNWGFSRNLIPKPSPPEEKGEGRKNQLLIKDPVYESGRDFCLGPVYFGIIKSTLYNNNIVAH